MTWLSNCIQREIMIPCPRINPIPSVDKRDPGHKGVTVAICRDCKICLYTLYLYTDAI